MRKAIILGLAVVAGVSFTACGSDSFAPVNDTKMANYYQAQVCNALTEIASGITNQTMTDSDVRHKMDVMVSNADNAALMSTNASYQTLDLGAKQFRAMYENGDSPDQIATAMATVAKVCGFGS